MPWFDLDDIVVKNASRTDINNRDDKKAKSKVAVRLVPINCRLIELGFLQYVADTRPLGQKELFPYVRRR